MTQTAFYLPEHLDASLEHLGKDRYHLFVNGLWLYAYRVPSLLIGAFRDLQHQGNACTVVTDGEVVFYCRRAAPEENLEQHR